MPDRAEVEERYPEFVSALGDKLWNVLESDDLWSAPLRHLLLGRDDWSRAVARRTDRALFRVGLSAPQWRAAKLRGIGRDRDPRNLAALLGEMRAYGAILHAWLGKVASQGEGADFVGEIAGADRTFTVGIEVTTVQASAKNTEIRGETHEREVTSAAGTPVRFRTTETAVASLRFPDNPWENVQSQAVWQLIQRKQRERQLGRHAISILWMDLQDLNAWPIRFSPDELLPFVTGNQHLTSGSFWWHVYGRKDDPIFSAASLDGQWSVVAPQATDGRFVAGSNADFIIADLGDTQAVFERPRSLKQIDETIYRQLYLLPHLALEKSWFSWPNGELLESRIEAARSSAWAFERAFQPAGRRRLETPASPDT